MTNTFERYSTPRSLWAYIMVLVLLLVTQTACTEDQVLNELNAVTTELSNVVALLPGLPPLVQPAVAASAAAVNTFVTCVEAIASGTNGLAEAGDIIKCGGSIVWPVNANAQVYIKVLSGAVAVFLAPFESATGTTVAAPPVAAAARATPAPAKPAKPIRSFKLPLSAKGQSALREMVLSTQNASRALAAYPAR